MHLLSRGECTAQGLLDLPLPALPHSQLKVNNILYIIVCISLSPTTPLPCLDTSLSPPSAPLSPCLPSLTSRPSILLSGQQEEEWKCALNPNHRWWLPANEHTMGVWVCAWRGDEGRSISRPRRPPTGRCRVGAASCALIHGGKLAHVSLSCPCSLLQIHVQSRCFCTERGASFCAWMCVCVCVCVCVFLLCLHVCVNILGSFFPPMHACLSVVCPWVQ